MMASGWRGRTMALPVLTATPPLNLLKMMTRFDQKHFRKIAAVTGSSGSTVSIHTTGLARHPLHFTCIIGASHIPEIYQHTEEHRAVSSL
ncbi:hypothetical protein F5Y18DRAFT_143106 [Xylariaceae sp. FL1019]|nr:hypothetical protein F5Y18DRAFT_143106 [Xylariaceae sp. FL1019]